MTLQEAIDATIRLGCIRMHWGARKPCDEYDDGRDLCAPCQMRVAIAADPPITVTVDLEDNPTLVGWVMNDE